MSGWRLLLTRPDEECAALAASLGEAGVHSSSLPLLAIDPLEETPEQRTLMLDLDRYCAVVVVSKPAAGAARPLLAAAAAADLVQRRRGDRGDPRGLRPRRNLP